MAGHEDFGGRLREALAEANVSQQQLAEQLGVSKTLVSLWVSNSRPVPADRLMAISDFLRVDLAYLKGAYVVTEPAQSNQDIEWVFRDAPSDGGRDYGNSNVFATPPDIRTLVRETGQNSKDQAVASTAHVRYTLIELSKGCAAFEAFMSACRFPELRLHVDAAASTRSRRGAAFKAALERLDRSDVLYLLRVEDFGTTGLYGEERTQSDDETNPFAALIRDNLNSSKQTRAAGGSWGLGKATLWRCSDQSTVLFASRVQGDPGGSGLLRFIGKSELTWHECDNRSHAGPGWLARGVDGDSAWIDPSQLESLFLDRGDLPPGITPSTSFGTSALIVAFRDPSGNDTTFSPESVVEDIARAAAENFWPAMVSGELEISVGIKRDGAPADYRQVDPADSPAAPFVSAMRAYIEGDISTTPEPGETTADVVHLTIPSTLSSAPSVPPGQPETETECEVVVKLAGVEDMAHSTLLNHIALVRGRGMVVRYWPRGNIVVGGRPFFGILLAGEAAGQGAAQEVAEDFLRFAEPPAHDEWRLTDDIRDNYVAGGGARLTELFEDVTAELRELIRPVEEGVEEEPEELKRLLDLGPGPTRIPQLAKLRYVSATFDNGVWEVSGDIAVLDRTKAKKMRLNFGVRPESGSGTQIPWQSVKLGKVTRGAARVLNEQSGTLLVKERTAAVPFRAISSQASGDVMLEHVISQVWLTAEEAQGWEAADE